MNMDREAKEYYEVIIQAKDMGGQLGGLAGTTTVNITLSDVNDNPPRFPQSEYPLCQEGQEGVVCFFALILAIFKLRIMTIRDGQNFRSVKVFFRKMSEQSIQHPVFQKRFLTSKIITTTFFLSAGN